MDLEKQVELWIAGFGGPGGIEGEDAEEIESHLWDCIAAEMYAGTAPDDAFRRAAARLGEPRLIAAVFAASALAANLFPAFEPYQTRILSAVHLPLMLWLAAGTVFCGADWRSPPARLDFLRSTGELLIYTVLILLGGGVLTVFTLGIFQLIGMDIKKLYMENIAVIGLFIAPIVAAYLTEKKRELVERFAPVLSFIFTPLFLITLLVFLAAMLILGKSPYTDREFLIVFNGILVLVLALTLFNITESKLKESTRIVDVMNGGLILAAFAIDAVALSAIIVRLASFGPTANRIAVLGENIILLANLLGLVFLFPVIFRFT